MPNVRRSVGQTSAMDDRGIPPAVGVDSGERSHHVEIFAISMAALLLEIAYTRVISFKLFYYYTYFVIGLALLGLGCGAVLITVSNRLRRAPTESILRAGLLGGAVTVAVGYVVTCRTPVSTLDIWEYGTLTSLKNLGALSLVCFAIFSAFTVVGVMIAAILGRDAGRVGGLYFADLAGGALACLLAVPLLDSIGAPATVFAGGAAMALTGAWVSWRTERSRLVPVGVLLALVVGAPMVMPDRLPEVRVDALKTQIDITDHTEWDAVFRVDAVDFGDRMLLFHDSLLGSGIYRWDGDVASLGRYDTDERSIPFRVAPEPARVLIIGAAGGNEVLASLHFGAGHVDAVELNPVTHSLVDDRFADYAGHLAQRPEVSWRQGDGRSFLGRTDNRYEMIWYPAPDSYAATNAATSGAFVLSESYLYTVEAIQDSLEHLRSDGVLVAQFGEQNFTAKPNRTSRYVSTARAALKEFGVEDPSGHVVLLTSPYQGSVYRNATVLVKPTPFTEREVADIRDQADTVPGTTVEYVPGTPEDANSIAAILTRSDDDLEAWYDDYSYDVRPVTDDGPFFWHFARFGDVVADIGEPIDRVDYEDTTGERVLLLLLVLAIVLGALLLLAPFFAVRSIWVGLPAKGRSAAYFGALGLGFMLFEVTLIQRLTLFLGFPTYSLTVTLASLLVFTGVGAALSPRTGRRPEIALPALAVAITALAAFYRFGLTPLTEAVFDVGLPLRVLITFLALAPLGLCLGTFMPLGLSKVASLTDHPAEYVAWGWAVNAFASVVGATLTTVLAMSFGFDVVLALALAAYLVALAVLRGLLRVPRVVDPTD